MTTTTVELNFVFTGDTYDIILDAFARRHGVQYEVVTAAGATGWTVVAFTGTGRQINELLLDYDGVL